MKTRITTEELKAKHKDRLKNVFVPVCFFGIGGVIGIVAAFVSGQVGIMPIFFLMTLISIVVLIVQLSIGKPEEAYLVAEPLTDGTVLETPPANDLESSTDNEAGVSLHFKFGENRDVQFMVPKADWEKAYLGKIYYVAYYKKSNKNFAYFDADEYEPDGTVEIREVRTKP